MTEQSSKKKKATVAAAVITALALLFTGTFAWVSTAQSATNQFVKTDYQVVLHDKFDGVDVEDGKSHKVEFDAGDTVNKDIWVENAGSDDILVRVKLTENMSIKQNSGAKQTIGTADAVHNLTDSATPAYGDACADIHSHVTWTSGTVKTYDEWLALETSARKGAFWVIAPDGWAYWMQALAPSDPTVTGDSIQPGTSAGHTGLLLDAVKLNESETGHIDYSIKAEMDAIDAGLVGLNEADTTWDSQYAKVIAPYLGRNVDNGIADQQVSEIYEALHGLDTEAADYAEKSEMLNNALAASNAAIAAKAEGNETEKLKQLSLSESLIYAVENGGTAEAVDNVGVVYTADDGSTMLTTIDSSCIDSNGVLTVPVADTVAVPDDIREKGLENMGTLSPEDKKKITEIVIPEGVKEIGRDPFLRLPNVEKISLPDSLKIIGPGAFCDYPKTIKEIEFPAGLEEIQEHAFRNMKFASSVTIPSSVTLGHASFQLTQIPGDLTINATKIEDTALQSCHVKGNLTISSKTVAEISFPFIEVDGTVRITESVESVSSRAFWCSKMKKIIIEEKAGRTYGDNILGEAVCDEVIFSNELNTLPNHLANKVTWNKLTLPDKFKDTFEAQINGTDSSYKPKYIGTIIYVDSAGNETSRTGPYGTAPTA